jgi:2-oxoglutarate/2-oxoacid ferredoxin oxidoreductase subunit beta
MLNNETDTLKRNSEFVAKDYETFQDVKWCPGCGDYVILKQVQTVLAEEGIKKEDTVFISGIGCSSRFTYHVDTYGMHSIHGRAPAIAVGVKTFNPKLSVWVVTGDGDALSIGGNHFIHTLRRNIDMNILLFNNQIYGLTKGQYSPTSELNKKTKSSPHGSIDYPFNPVALALGSGGTFIARTMDNDPRHMRSVLKKANKHKGTSFVEIYQNCNTFNDKIFSRLVHKDVKKDRCLFLKHGFPLIFGENEDKGIILDGLNPKIAYLKEGVSEADLWVHDEKDLRKAKILSDFFNDPDDDGFLPRPFGVFYSGNKHCYESLLEKQIKETIKKYGEGDLDSILAGKTTWEVN